MKIFTGSAIKVPHPVWGFFLTLGLIILFIGINLLNNSNDSVNLIDINCDCNDVEKQLNEIERDQKLCIAVVGDRVPEKNTKNSLATPYPEVNSIGKDIYQGVLGALRRDELDTSLVTILTINDGGRKDCAERIAQKLSKSKIVLCVIGHSTTATTEAALPYYKMANIPILLPSATNPDLIIKYKSICFRLPSNDEYQVKTIKKLITEDLKPKNIYLVYDETETATKYSQYLKNKISLELGGIIRREQAIKYTPYELNNIVESIPYSDVDCIVFCGYGSMAVEFFSVLSEKYSNINDTIVKNNIKPKVILSDGCNVKEIYKVPKLGFDSYLLFPCKISKEHNSVNYMSDVIDSASISDGTSYELYGHDAVMILANAIGKNRPGYKMNRNILIDRINNLKDGVNTIGQYSFKDGENTIISYEVYKADSLSLYASLINNKLIKNNQ